MDRFDIGIIGAGVAGAFASYRIVNKYPDKKTILFELGRPPFKRRRFCEGFLGCLPNNDGKIHLNDIDNVKNIADKRATYFSSKWIFNLFDFINQSKIIKDSLPSSSLQKKLSENNFEIIKNDYIQWKPDSIHKLSKHIADSIENSNVQLSFDNEVTKIYKKKDYFIVATANGDFLCKKLILCAGRSGWRWVNSLFKDFGILVNDNFATFGVRVEIAAKYMKEFNNSHCTLYRDNLEIGPLCWYGTVIPEDHADVVISNFRSNEERWKTDKVSFSILASKIFKDQGCYQTDRLAKLAFLLFNDRVGKERIKIFTKNNSQLNLLPEYNWLKEIFEELDNIIPNLISRGYIYVPNILPMASEIKIDKNLSTEIEGLYVAGESAGIRGIAAAAITGAIAADSICKEY